MTDRSIFLFEINKNNLQSDLYICFFCVCVPFLWRIWLYAFTLLFLLFIIASIIQNISGLKPIPFALLFHDLKVMVNRWYDYMFIRRVFIGGWYYIHHCSNSWDCSQYNDECEINHRYLGWYVRNNCVARQECQGFDEFDLFVWLW